MPSAFHPFGVELPSGPEGRWRPMSEKGVVCVGHGSHLTGNQEGVARGKPLEREEGEISERNRERRQHGWLDRQGRGHREVGG